MKRARVAVGFFLLSGAIACSSSSSSTGGGGGGGGSATGTMFGTAFTPTSSFAAASSDGSVDLIFTSTADACGDAKTGTVRAGGTYVQLFGLTKQADGTWANSVDPGDIKAAKLDPACNGSGIQATRASKSVVHIDSTSGPATGSVDLTFADGSTFAGTFSIPLCTSTLTDSACK